MRQLLSGAGLLSHSDERGLHVRCPHCRNPIELVDDAELDSVTCTSCGSSFSLIAAEETKSYTADKRRTDCSLQHRRQSWERGHSDRLSSL